MEDFAQDYYLLIFIASLGVLQIVASYSGLRSILFFKRSSVARLGGMAAIIAAFVWFFASEPRNINDTRGGLDANNQALLFALASLTAVIATLIGSSLVNVRMRGNSTSPEDGLEALKETSFLQALSESLSRWWKKWQKQMQKYFSG
ncbi:MAG: hypothetical protein HY666_04855 [Chloroflexi bacterium]|nr:hypothetical protein [Chloroflexota bacterium]